MASRARPFTPAASDALSCYLDEIGRIPLLSAPAESDLARRAHAGDTDAIDALVRANLRFVVAIAKRYRWQGLPLEDRISDGNLGLVRAAQRFDPSKGTRFTTYAIWWVRQAILQGLADHAGVMRMPLDRIATLYDVGRRARGLAQTLGREPTHDEIAAESSLSTDEVARLLSITRSALSLDTSAAAAGDGALLDRLADGTSDASTPLLREALADDVAQALAALPPREAHTIRLSFGLDGEEPMTLLEIGRVLGVTRERARQIKVLALHHLRHRRSGRRLAMHRD